MRPGETPNDGLGRYTIRKVVFTKPFTLGEASETYPAGVYEIETKEQPFEVAGHLAHVRTSTVLTIPMASGTCYREVRGSELDEAILRDAERAGPRQPTENPDRGDAEGDQVLS